MSPEKYEHISRHAQRVSARFVRCEGVLYEVSSRVYPTGPGRLWSVDEVRPVEIPAMPGNNPEGMGFEK